MQRSWATRSNLVVALAAAMALFACSSSEKEPGATETNVTPAPCDSNDDCPSQHCIVGAGGESGTGGATLGFCELADGGTTVNR